MRWPNGGPPKLYVLVMNATGTVLHFERKQARTEWLKAEHATYPDGMYTFLTYAQEAKK